MLTTTILLGIVVVLWALALVCAYMPSTQYRIWNRWNRFIARLNRNTK